jgi:hypothetical protein
MSEKVNREMENGKSECFNNENETDKSFLFRIKNCESTFERKGKISLT